MPPASFAAVAGVSVNFLYSHDELRTRIQQLRGQQDRAIHCDPLPLDEPGAVVRSLTSKLTAERRRRQDEVGLLREQLAAAHGELLRLRRGAGGTAAPGSHTGDL